MTHNYSWDKATIDINKGDRWDDLVTKWNQERQCNLQSMRLLSSLYMLHVYQASSILPVVHAFGKITIKNSIVIRSPWASCQIRKIAGAHASGMPGTISPSSQVSDPDMHHGTCGTHVPWCMPGSLTSSFLWNRRRGKTFPAFPAHAQPAIIRIW